ncbi:MAG TPA: beta-propeller fold lactonase family protein [Bryobacteraceae bacterium]|nr:beta-propeller fold lactonase family protein [Bryobacteraceae bacterium]
MRFDMKWMLAAGAALTAAALVSQEPGVVRPGPRADGSVLLHNGWVLRPAGKQTPLSTFPMASAVSRDGKYTVIMQGGYMKPSLSVHESATLREISRVEVKDAWLGMAFAPNTNILYVSGGSASAVMEFELTPEGRLEARRTFPLVAEAARKHTDFAGDVAVSPDGRLIYVAALYRDSIWVINPQSGMVIEEFKSAHRPYRILFHPDGKSFFVTGWGDGSVYHQSAQNGEVLQRIGVGPQPMDMVWRDKPLVEPEGEAGETEAKQPVKFTARLFVAVSNTNNVTVLGVADDKRLSLSERINVALYPVMPAGMTPSALALSADQNRLYVICSDANAVAVADVSAARSTVAGFIPTAWYPTSARELPGARLMVLNGRGPRGFANPGGPNPTRRTAPVHLGNSAVEYVGAIQKGTASLIEPYDAQQLMRWSRTVLANAPYKPRMMDDAGAPAGSVVPSHPGGTTPIEHVIYIVKENRTYDQVLGDLDIGNGDASLTLFGAEVSPNHHKLAREFVLLDNFYVNADVSADGHNWTSAAIAPAYVQRMWPNSYGARRRHYDYEGGERAALPPAGYIWTNVLAKGLTMRNYGWWCTNAAPAPESGRQIRAVRDQALAAHTNLDYRGFDLDYLDIDRAKVFLKDLETFEAQGAMPQFIVLRIGNDHTSGTSPGKRAPRSAMADNDLALGMIVEGVSRSKFWPKTAIFVLEDDAQNGPDHVDSHRSPAFVISPYTRGRGVDSTHYSTTSMLRTMELILGLHPMTLHDAGARPMYAAFGTDADSRPYEKAESKLSLDERNAAANATAAQSMRMDWSEADRIDDNELNRILWLAVRGSDPPPPVRSFHGR